MDRGFTFLPAFLTGRERGVTQYINRFEIQAIRIARTKKQG